MLRLESASYSIYRRDGEERPAKLIDLEVDQQETTDVSAARPEVVERLLALAEKAHQDLGDVGIEGEHQRPAGMVVSPKPLYLGKQAETI